MNKAKNILLLSLLIIVTLFIIIYLILQVSIGKPAKATVINKLKLNEKLFEEIYEELYELKENPIYFKKNGNDISISIYEEINKKTNIINVDNEEFYKYEKTIKNIKILKLTEVKKEHENLIIPIKNFGQYIIKINNDEKLNWGYNIIYIKQINNNWYYVETKI